MDLINWVFTQYLDKFVVIFIDDILVYFKNKEELGEHLSMVWKILRKIFIKNLASVNSVKRISFLEHIISGNQIFMDPRKVDAVKECHAPKFVT